LSFPSSNSYGNETPIRILRTPRQSLVETEACFSFRHSPNSRGCFQSSWYWAGNSCNGPNTPASTLPCLRIISSPAANVPVQKAPSHCRGRKRLGSFPAHCEPVVEVSGIRWPGNFLQSSPTERPCRYRHVPLTSRVDSDHIGMQTVGLTPGASPRRPDKEVHQHPFHRTHDSGHEHRS